MAPFNPEVPKSNDPSWLSLSKAIEPFQGDMSTGVMLKGVGNILESGGKATENVVDSIIDQRVRESVDRNRDAQTAALEAGNQIPQENRVSNNVMDLIPGATAAPVPDTLSAGTGNISTLYQAGPGGSGKLRSTYYHGRLTMEQKDLRSEFPGWRDYIDKKYESVSGENSANAYMKNLLDQLNESMTHKKSEEDKDINFIKEHSGDVPNAAELIRQRKAGLIDTAGIVEAVSKYTVPMSKFKMNTAKYTDWKQGEEQLVSSMKQNASDLADKQFANTWTTVTKSLEKTLGYTPADIAEIAQKANTAEGKLDNQQIQAIGNALFTARHDAYLRLSKEMDAPIKTADGKFITYRGKLGHGEVEALLSDRLKPYDETLKLISEGKFGLAERSANMFRARAEDTGVKLMAESKYGDTLASINWFSKHISPQAGQFLFQEGYGAGLGTDMRAFLDKNKIDLVAPYDPKNPWTLRQAIENGQKNNVGIPKPGASDNEVKVIEDQRKVYQELIAFPTKILSKDLSDYAKNNLIMNSFGPGNEGLISKFANGPERVKAYSNLTSPAMVGEIKRLGAINPSILEAGKNWTEKTFANELFPEEIRNLAKYQERAEEFKDIHVRYDADNQKFFLENTPLPRTKNQYGITQTMGSSLGREAFLRKAEESVARLNAGISGLANYGKDKDEANVYVLRTMIGLGIKPDGLGIDSKMMKAVMNSKPDPFENPEGRIDYKPGKQSATEDTTLELSGRTRTPVTTRSASLPAEAKALLDTIAGSESPDYNVRYGGSRFSDYNQFPKGAFPITSGPNAGKYSSASGRYQFIRSTWEAQAEKLGLKDFSPESQDVAAWDLAKTAYARKYPNRSLEEDIRSPSMGGKIASALKSEWTSLPGGIEASKTGKQFVSNLQEHFKRYDKRIQEVGVDTTTRG